MGPPSLSYGATGDESTRSEEPSYATLYNPGSVARFIFSSAAKSNLCCRCITSVVKIQYMSATRRKPKGCSGKYVTIYLDKALYRQFLHEALARKLTVGKVIKERLLEREKERTSVYDRVKHLVGSVDGPADLSTNPKYLQGFGEDLRPAGRK
jgi:hypothetical protein